MLNFGDVLSFSIKQSGLPSEVPQWLCDYPHRQWPREGTEQAGPAESPRSRLGSAATLSGAAGSPVPGPHHPDRFHSCLKTLLWFSKPSTLLQQTQHLGSREGPYNAQYNTNKHDCYKKIRLQNITLCQTPVDCNFSVLAAQRAREILKFSSSSYSEGCSSTPARKNLEWKV